MIESGYCIYVRDFLATVEQFKTISVEYAKDTVPWYEIVLGNGVQMGANETDLVYSKEELECKCAELNEKMRQYREDRNGGFEMKSINLNDNVKVKLSPLGAEIYYNQNKDLIDAHPHLRETMKPRMPKIDSDGYTEFQLHHFISLYGEHIGMAKQNVIDPLNIYFEEDVLR